MSPKKTGNLTSEYFVN